MEGNNIKEQIVKRAKHLISNLERYVEIGESINSLSADQKDSLADRMNKTLSTPIASLTERIALEHSNSLYTEVISKLNIITSENFNDNEMQYSKLVYDILSSVPQNLLNQFVSHEINIVAIIDNTADFTVSSGLLHEIHTFLFGIEASILTFFQQLAQLDYFRLFKELDKNYVIIGANGSGKSSFSRITNKIFKTQIAIIPAQKVFNISSIDSVPIGNKSLTNVHNYQGKPKLGKELNNNHDYSNDLQNLMLSLIENYITCSTKLYAENERNESILDKAMVIWNELISHRTMEYSNRGHNIKIKGDTDSYDFHLLSDGEKAVFYYIAHVLLAKENSYIIIDEPENHLNMAIVCKLWDQLEQSRLDCKFIYLTHNLDFATSRTMCKKLWCKSFTAPATWDIVPLEENNTIPELLLMQLVGSRKKILFCEGKNDKLDFKLYSILFPNYTVKPVDGHLRVIEYTKAFNALKDFHGNSAIGIIDGDFHLDAVIHANKKKSIYTLPFQEVENSLCDGLLLEAGVKRFFTSSVKLDEAKVELFNKINKDKESQAMKYIQNIINNELKSNLLQDIKSKDNMKAKFSELLNTVDNKIEDLYKERILLFEQIYNTKDYDLGIKNYNNKGLPSIIGNKIVNDYEDKILKLLKDDSQLLEKFRNKHFSEIPVE